MDYLRMSLAFCKLRLRGQIRSRSEASERLLALRNQGPSKERQELESQLREDALFQSRMEELRQSMLPRLEEILRELLKCRRQIYLPNEGRAQLAINILCEEILSKGLKGAQHFVTYVYGNQETADREQFIRWHENASAQQESSMRTVALREKVIDLKAKLANCEKKLKDQGSDGDLKKLQQDRAADLEKIEKLEDERAADLRKIRNLEKQQGDNITAREAARAELERVRSELQRVLNRSKEGESKQEAILEATKAELDSVRSDLRHVQIKLAESKKRESMHEAELEATKVDLESVCSVAKRAREMLEDERKHATTLRLDVERRTLEANAELEHVRSELKHAQTELKAERDRSTEAAFKYQADLKTAEVELGASRSELQCVHLCLDKERDNSRSGRHEYQTTLYARKAEIEHAHSGLQRMRAELDAERDRSTKAESELKAELDCALSTKSDALCSMKELETEMKQLKNNAAATKNLPHSEALKGTFDGERLHREGRDSTTPEYLINPESEQSSSALQDAYGSSAPASPAVPASEPEPVARPLKTPRLSAKHKYATQPNTFKIEYVGLLADSPEALQLPEPPEGKSWLDYYKQHELETLSEAQSSKADGQKVALGPPRSGKNRCITCLLSSGAKCLDAKPEDIDDTYAFRGESVDDKGQPQCQSFLDQAVLNRKVPGRWMGDGAEEFTAKYVAPPVVRRPHKKVNPNDHAAVVASMILAPKLCWKNWERAAPNLRLVRGQTKDKLITAASRKSETRVASRETTTENSSVSSPVLIPTAPLPESLSSHLEAIENCIRSSDGLSDISIPNIKPIMFRQLADKLDADRKFRLEYYRDREVVTVKWPSNAHEGYKPLISALMDVAQHDINFSCETNSDIRFVDGPHKGTTAVPDFGFGKYPTNSTADMEYIIILESGYSQPTTKLRDRARMWLTLPTVISVITIDFCTKQFGYPKSNPGHKMVPLSRIAFGKQARSLLEAITVGGETWAHPITAIELTLYVQRSGRRIHRYIMDLKQSQTEIDASLGAVFSTATGRDTFDESNSDKHPFHINWSKLYEQLHLRRTTDSFNRYREWIDESSASASQPTVAPPAPKRVSASELQEFIKRPRVT
ncbi:hypothetical protein GGX14DRAFT_400225 [Mycena pura]|uniref:Uncharacterized protein n=1 Tax=Mycena pura TaxID=153505 RepID=A0AAD6V6B9_9AGAR|nr:hypothetical protein GGX14DRAFT_400225 [Mycena pura]